MIRVIFLQGFFHDFLNSRHGPYKNFQFVHARLDGFGDGDGVAVVGELHRKAGTGLAVQAERGGVGLLADFDAGNVFQADGSTTFGTFSARCFQSRRRWPVDRER